MTEKCEQCVSASIKNCLKGILKKQTENKKNVCQRSRKHNQNITEK